MGAFLCVRESLGRRFIRVNARETRAEGKQVAGKLLDRASPFVVMHGSPESGRSVPPEADRSANLHSRIIMIV
jgi:hypothetical protein